MSVADYNTDPDSNTSISGINIAEGCPPSGINNAIRQMMADIKTADNANVKLTGNQTVAGIKKFTNSITEEASYPAITINRTYPGSTATNPSDLRFANNGNNEAEIRLTTTNDLQLGAKGSGDNWYNGPALFLKKDNTFEVRSGYGGTTYKLVGSASGGLTWAGKDIITNGGDQTVGGTKTFSSALKFGVQDFAFRTGDSSYLGFQGGSADGNGAIIRAYGKDHTNSGWFFFRAKNASQQTDMVGKPDGTLTWGGKGFVYDSGAQTIAGAKTFTSHIKMSGAGANTIMRTEDDSVIYVCGATSIANGAFLAVSGKDRSTNAGTFMLRAISSTYKDFLGKPDGTLTWNGQPIQTSSDERLKTPLADIPDAVLDAWGDVGWGQFQYLEAVSEKGAEKARLHLGLIAQRVKAVFEERGLDACAYGILCHEERPATDEEPAVDLWMVRYTEAAAMEAAYQRRRADRAEARIASLERRLDALEAAFVAAGA